MQKEIDLKVLHRHQHQGFDLSIRAVRL
jgi:hypothetical protein